MKNDLPPACIFENVLLINCKSTLPGLTYREFLKSTRLLSDCWPPSSGVVRLVPLGGHTPIFDYSVRVTQTKTECFKRVFHCFIRVY